MQRATVYLSFAWLDSKTTARRPRRTALKTGDGDRLLSVVRTLGSVALLERNWSRLYKNSSPSRPEVSQPDARTRAETFWRSCGVANVDKKMMKPLRFTNVRKNKPKASRRGPDRHRQIVAAASELFARKGFEGASIREIAAASGFYLGTVKATKYWRFSTSNSAELVGDL